MPARSSDGQESSGRGTLQLASVRGGALPAAVRGVEMLLVPELRAEGSF